MPDFIRVREFADKIKQVFVPRKSAKTIMPAEDKNINYGYNFYSGRHYFNGKR
ncbi:MAG: hypothetical protein M3525_02050 [Acidobacteriota bacterium]|nr:hypothetical protein [Acidobacteriota bacterium]